MVSDSPHIEIDMDAWSVYYIDKSRTSCLIPPFG